MVLWAEQLFWGVLDFSELPLSPSAFAPAAQIISALAASSLALLTLAASALSRSAFAAAALDCSVFEASALAALALSWLALFAPTIAAGIRDGGVLNESFVVGETFTESALEVSTATGVALTSSALRSLGDLPLGATGGGTAVGVGALATGITSVLASTGFLVKRCLDVPPMWQRQEALFAPAVR